VPLLTVTCRILSAPRLIVALDLLMKHGRSAAKFAPFGLGACFAARCCNSATVLTVASVLDAQGHCCHSNIMKHGLASLPRVHAGDGTTDRLTIGCQKAMRGDVIVECRDNCQRAFDVPPLSCEYANDSAKPVRDYGRLEIMGHK